MRPLSRVHKLHSHVTAGCVTAPLATEVAARAASSAAAGARAGAGGDASAHPRRPAGSPSPLESPALLRHQATMPKLPVPPLDLTLADLRGVVEPLLQTAGEEGEFAAALHKFAATPAQGPALQDRLVELDAALPHSTFVTQYWNDSYFTGRYPVPINGNPCVRYKSMTDSAGAPLSQARTAACLAHGAAVITHAMFTHAYEPCVEGGRPMCMGQIGAVLGCCRVPQRGRDGFTSPATRGAVPTHVTLLRGPHVYELPVLTPALSAVPVDDLERAIQRVLDDAPDDDTLAAPALAHLTAADRDTWADARQDFVSGSPTNAALLQSVQEGLFVLSLSPSTPGDDLDAAMRLFLHGDAKTPMWFDKLSVAVCADGITGLAFEHSGFDGAFSNRVFVRWWRW